MGPTNGFDPQQAVKKLLREARSGAMATLMAADGAPYCSLVNVATAADGAPLLLLSRLAVHTKNILADARVSLMLDERKPGDPLEDARVMLAGRARRSENAADRRRYLARQPEAEAFAGFGDFAIYRVTLERAHLVAGFGRILDLPAEQITTDIAAADRLLEAEAEICAHLNADHGDDLRRYATHLQGDAAGDGWRCAGCDPEGLELQRGRLALRLPFINRVNTPGELRRALRQWSRSAGAR